LAGLWYDWAISLIIDEAEAVKLIAIALGGTLYNSKHPVAREARVKPNYQLDCTLS